MRQRLFRTAASPWRPAHWIACADRLSLLRLAKWVVSRVQMTQAIGIVMGVMPCHDSLICKDQIQLDHLSPTPLRTSFAALSLHHPIPLPLFDLFVVTYRSLSLVVESPPFLYYRPPWPSLVSSDDLVIWWLGIAAWVN